MELAVIGAGPAGLSAAIRAKEAGITDVRVIERGALPGGILNQCIHHGFGLHVFKEELTGPEYAHRLIERAKELDITFVYNAMVLEISAEREIVYATPGGLVREAAQAVILAMGCRERARGALGIPGSRPAGVYAAGTAQALVNMKGCLPGKNVVVLGSGDIGLIMARRMILEGAKVLGVYELMPYSGGLKRNIAQCLNDYDIPLYLSHTVTRTEGRKRLTGVFVAPVDESLTPIYAQEKFIACDTLLLSVGLIPENELSKMAGVHLSRITGGGVVNDRLETNIPGIFACGNVLHVHDLADNVTLEAYAAAENAARFIKGELPAPEADIPVISGAGVRYTVPMTLTKTKGTFELLFRSDHVYKPAVVRVLADGAAVKTQKKRILTPGEMERVQFTLENETAKVEVTVTEV